MAEPVERSDIEALLSTRRELGEEYDAALVASFTDRVEQAIAARDRAEVASRDRHQRSEARHQQTGRTRQFVLGLVSVVAGIPITVVATVGPDQPSVGTVALAWLGLAGVNAAHASVVNGPRRRTD
ncbi:hypothetical protein K8W59_08780 [Nocardioides rotundus]|uniref:hypothetical protein n=1 Tax=Nocardioides rotundus TaxID=1774216 RepID=UPI001CC037DA|nr:hypothetical protein [Nocardioides rotundus]UAL31510.1 hypothetical protein K8W59_08780 [Nocardioides rotundus]